jgi:hypothetical protein
LCPFKLGQFIRGAVTPPVASVEIVATHQTDPAGDLTERALTGPDGRFAIGPLWSAATTDWRVKARLAGYEFRPADPKTSAGDGGGFNFLAQRLSQLKLHFADAKGNGYNF